MRRIAVFTHETTSLFQSTHPRGVRHVHGAEFRIAGLFQSTHPRGVRHRRRIWTCRLILVSIHAPAWGATDNIHCTKGHRHGFNPRTRVGCDSTRLRAKRRKRMFQSTHPRGVRQQFVVHGLDLFVTFQSTHPRGVRPLSCRLMSGLSASFNPRTRVGCDRTPLLLSRLRISFNPRTRVGCDHRPPPDLHPQTGFNPRTRVGCDTSASLAFPARSWFQSTHPRGVRPEARVWEDDRHVFQSTHPRGVRHPAAVLSGLPYAGFNPRTRVGCDGGPLGFHHWQGRFQSTHPRGVRRSSGTWWRAR